MSEGKLTKVPLQVGANSDEGVSFSVHGLNNATAIFNSLMLWRSYALTPPGIRKLLELFPNDPAHEPPYRDISNETSTNYGLEWRRDAAISGDLVMIAQQRKMCKYYTCVG